MGMQPKVPKVRYFTKTCTECGETLKTDSFSPAKSSFFPDKYFPICNNCIKKYLQKNSFSWDSVDNLCQYGNIPFIPQQFERLHEMNGDDVFPAYANVFQDAVYDGLNWGDYYKEYVKLKERNLMDEVLPEIREEKYRKLREKWGGNYDEDQLVYLEGLLNGLMRTQNISGALQLDQAIKLCKISLLINERIEAGEDFDKLLSSYEKLTKVGNFTPKNVKNINDFDTVGELIKWLERGGWHNQYYDNVSRDVVDETIRNIQAWTQRLYTNENSIGDEITRRIESLKAAETGTSYYDLKNQYDLESYDDDDDELPSDDEQEEFKAEI